VSTNRSPTSASKSPKTSWTHKSACVDDEGRIVCCCSLRESLDLHDQSVAERAPEFGPEEP